MRYVILECRLGKESVLVTVTDLDTFIKADSKATVSYVTVNNDHGTCNKGELQYICALSH